MALRSFVRKNRRSVGPSSSGEYGKNISIAIYKIPCPVRGICRGLQVTLVTLVTTQKTLWRLFQKLLRAPCVVTVVTVAIYITYFFCFAAVYYYCRKEGTIGRLDGVTKTDKVHWMHKDRAKHERQPRVGQFYAWTFSSYELRRNAAGALDAIRVDRLVRDNMVIDGRTGKRSLSPDCLVDVERAFDYGRGKVMRPQIPLYYSYTCLGVQVRTSKLLVSKPVTGTRSFQFSEIERQAMAVNRLMETATGRSYVRKVYRSAVNVNKDKMNLSVNVNALSHSFVIACCKAWVLFTAWARSVERMQDSHSYPDTLSPALVRRKVSVTDIDGEWTDGQIVGLDGHAFNSTRGCELVAQSNAWRDKYASSVVLVPRGLNVPMPKKSVCSA